MTIGDVFKTLNISSDAFDDDGFIPSKYTCDGQNISPPLTISSPPPETVSLALIMDDPDAPMGTFTHWLLWNIDPSTSEFAPGSPPPGVHQGLNGRGQNGYTGPCPPSGTHRYYFHLYALDSWLDLSDNIDRKYLEDNIKNHLISEATLMGLYSRGE